MALSDNKAGSQEQKPQTTPRGSALVHRPRLGRSGPGLHPHPIDPYPFGDVLDVLRTKIPIAKGYLGLDLVEDRPRDAETSRLGQPLEAGRDVDSIPIDPLPLGNDISQVDADAKLHAAVGQ